MEDSLFGSELWKPALEKYSQVTGLTVELFDAHGLPALGPIGSTPLFDLFREHGVDTELFAACARRCLRQTAGRPAVVGSEYHGLTVVGTSLALEGIVVGVAVAGFALCQFSQASMVQRWAQTTKVPFDRLWHIVRVQAPVPQRRLTLHGELLQVLGDALLQENCRTRQYQDALAKLNAASATKDEFLAILSHELRAPLAPIVGWTSVLRRLQGPPEMYAAAEAIERNARLQSRLVDELLDLNVVARGTVKLDLRLHELSALLHAAVEGAAAEAAAKRIQLELVAHESLTIEGDAGRLQQIFGNILANALKFTPDGGRVTVGLARDAGEAVVTFTDTGEGIAPEFLPFVFDIFRQQESGTRRRHEGLGIGLALVKQLTALHHGSVAVASAGAGRGTQVSVRLPLARQSAAREAPASPGRTAALAGLSVLLVEDSDDARNSLRMLLQLNGATVRVACEGRQALDLVREQVPDVVVCDLRMPNMDGYEFMEKLSRVRALDAPPVVALSGLVSEAEQRRTRQAGFKAHLAKPVEEGALVDAINAALKGSGSGLSRELH